MRSRRSDQTRPPGLEKAQRELNVPVDENLHRLLIKASAFFRRPDQLEGCCVLSLLHLGHALTAVIYIPFSMPIVQRLPQ